MKIFKILVSLLFVITVGCIEHVKIIVQQEEGKLVLTLDKEMTYTDLTIYKWSKDKPYDKLIYSIGTKELRELKDYPSTKVLILGVLPADMIEYDVKESVKLDDLKNNCLYSIVIAGFGKTGLGFFVIVSENGQRKIINLTYEEADKFRQTGIINGVNYW